jgi:3-dehydroquinate synthase
LITRSSLSFSVDGCLFKVDKISIKNDISNFIVQSRLGDYQVIFNHFDLTNEFIDSVLSNNSVLIIDSNLLNIYKLRITDQMIVIDAFEEAKSFDKIHIIIDQLIYRNVNKGTEIIALGGGIVQDITAFTVSIFRRGLKWKYYPTTLLAQSDSCIGAKTALNYRTNKNLIGLFSSPSEVVINSKLTKTLKDVDILNGYGEIIKLAIIAGEYFFHKASRFIINEPSYDDFQSLISQSLLIKKEIIEFDELEQSIRQVLNYGHTIGHAIEAESEFSIPHGISVLMGIIIENRIALEYNLCDSRFVNEIEDTILNILNKTSFKKKIKNINPKNLFERLRLDKKTKINVLPTVLPRFFGDFITFELHIDSNLHKLIEKIMREINYGPLN